MIIVRLKGGLGNQLFQYALGWRLARENDLPLRMELSTLNVRRARHDFTPREYCLDVFGIPIAPATNIDLWRFGLGFGNDRIKSAMGRILSRVPGLRRRIMREQTAFMFNPACLTPTRARYLDGFWQSDRYFADHADALRDHLGFVHGVPAPADLLLHRIKNESSICLHVRRGDYVGNRVHTLLSPDYYKDAIRFITNGASNFSVFVFSDDPDWCARELDIGQPFTVVEDKFSGFKASGHLQMMSACHHFVIANSSFSWWAAWLGRRPGKKVILPRKWITDRDTASLDIVPEGWVVLPRISAE